MRPDGPRLVCVFGGPPASGTPSTSTGPSEPPPPGGQDQPSSSTQPSLSLTTDSVVPSLSGSSSGGPPMSYSFTASLPQPSLPVTTETVPPGQTGSVPPPGGQGLPTPLYSQTGGPPSSLLPPPPPGGQSVSPPPGTYSQTGPGFSTIPPPPGGQSESQPPATYPTGPGSPPPPGGQGLPSTTPTGPGSPDSSSGEPSKSYPVTGMPPPPSLSTSAPPPPGGQDLPSSSQTSPGSPSSSPGEPSKSYPATGMPPPPALSTSTPVYSKTSPGAPPPPGGQGLPSTTTATIIYDSTSTVDIPPTGSETAPPASNSVPGSMSISTLTDTVPVSVSTTTAVVSTVTDCIPLPGLGPGGQASMPSGCPPWSLSIGSGSVTLITGTTDIGSTASTVVPTGSASDSVPISSGGESSLVTFPPPTETISLTASVTVPVSSGSESKQPERERSDWQRQLCVGVGVRIHLRSRIGVSLYRELPRVRTPVGNRHSPPPIITDSLPPPFMNTSSLPSSSPPTVSVTGTVSITSTAAVGPPPNGQSTDSVGSDTSCTPTTFSTSVRPSRSYPDSSASDTTCTTDDASTPTLVHFGNVTSAIPTQGTGVSRGGDDDDASSSSSDPGAGATGTASATGVDGSLPTGVADPSGFVTVLTSSSILVTEAVPTASASGGLGGGLSSSAGDSGAASSTTSSAATCTPTQDTVMIENGGFERGLSPWQVGAFEPLLTDYYITKPDGAPGSGADGSCRSLAVDLTNGGDNWGGQWWDFELRSPVVIRLSPSPQRYVLSFSLKFALANQARVVAVLDGVRVATVVAERDSAGGAGAWTQWGVTFELGAKRNFAVLRFEYYLNGASENTIWIDGIDIAPYLAALPVGNATAPASPSSRGPLAETAVVAVQTTKTPGS
ncbi:hypothetical protein PG991_010664 [Apiospora marii]|uniref:CBM6 domain-containing protein n=1 Tax=Apiospora marii TaxID=335849 RepID=A0ABR1RC09_9PEZI